MEKTVLDHLIDALEDLLPNELSRFRVKLNEVPLPPGFANIPRGKLHEATPLELSRLLVDYYTDQHAVQVAAKVLDSIHLKGQAAKLLALSGTGKYGSVQNPMPTFSGASGRYGSHSFSPPEPTSAGLHFIDKHRKDLIQRTATVEAVLDRIYGSILSHEQYERILSQKTNADKMRELYSLVPSWNCSCKDELYEALKATNKFLIEDLEGR